VDLFEFLETNSLTIWLSESTSIFAYPTLLVFHTFGMAFLAGTSTAISLRLLGFAAGVPLAPLRKFFPFIWLGLAMSAVSGVLLLTLDAKYFLTMPAFYIKILAVVSAVTIVRLLRNSVFSDQAGADAGPVARKYQVLAGAVLISWMVAVGAGRVTAYLPITGWKTAAAVLIVAAVLSLGRIIALRLWGTKTSA
jgi:hypothetical protein